MARHRLSPQHRGNRQGIPARPLDADRNRTLDVLFDATDIHTSNGVHGVIFYDLGIARVMTYIAKSPTLVSLPDIGVGALRILKAVAAGGSP
jgi:hypothetical protein